jgi:hypothetical protein
MATRVAQEANKSSAKNTDEAVNSLYEIISQYNGIIRTIIETIEPVKGKWSTRLSVNQSTVGYFTAVLKGLIEPLKHLMFQLSNINDPTIAGMTNMFLNMVNIIDQSPPFREIDIKAYRNGKPNVEGLSDDLQFTSLKPFIAYANQKIRDLKMQSDSPNSHIKQAVASIGKDEDTNNGKDTEAVLRNQQKKQMRDDVRRIGQEKYKDAKDLMKMWQQEAIKAKNRYLADPKSKVMFPGNLEVRTKRLINELNSGDWMSALDVESLAQVVKDDISGKKLINKRTVKEELELLEQSKKRWEDTYKEAYDSKLGVLDTSQMDNDEDAISYQHILGEIEKRKREIKNPKKKISIELKTNANTNADAAVGERRSLTAPSRESVDATFNLRSSIIRNINRQLDELRRQPNYSTNPEYIRLTSELQGVRQTGDYNPQVTQDAERLRNLLTQPATQPPPPPQLSPLPSAPAQVQVLPLSNTVGALPPDLSTAGEPGDDDQTNVAGLGYGFIKSDFNQQQYNYMGRPLSNCDKINNDMINANNNWQLLNNLPHDTPVGNLNPFLAKPEVSKYSYVDELRKANSVMHPEHNALGADISLLQGPITNISGSGASKKKPKALEKIEGVAIDEKNDMFKKTPMGDNGMIPEEKEDQFKFPELRPKKEKSGRRR